MHARTLGLQTSEIKPLALSANQGVTESAPCAHWGESRTLESIAIAIPGHTHVCENVNCRAPLRRETLLNPNT